MEKNGVDIGFGTSVNTTGCSPATPFTCASPACRNTRRHQVSVLSGIPCCCPYSRSVNPLPCHWTKLPHISRARTDIGNPIHVMQFIPPIHSFDHRITGGDVLGPTLTILN